MVLVREISLEDEGAWRALWAGYTGFYEVAIPKNITDSTWARLFDASSALRGYVAELEGKVVGFSISLTHESTWAEEPACYLEDLYVDENIRGKGIGRALVQNLIDISKAQGWAKLYWHTRPNNEKARLLYDKMAKLDDYVKYCVLFDK